MQFRRLHPVLLFCLTQKQRSLPENQLLYLGPCGCLGPGRNPCHSLLPLLTPLEHKKQNYLENQQLSGSEHSPRTAEALVSQRISPTLSLKILSPQIPIRLVRALVHTRALGSHSPKVCPRRPRNKPGQAKNEYARLTLCLV